MAQPLEYLPLRRRARAAVTLLVVYMLMSLVAIPLDVMQLGASKRAAAGQISEDEAMQYDLLVGSFAIVQLIIVVATAIAFCMWLYRARRNILALGVPGVYYSPGYAVGSFFIPFVNLLVPFRAMKEAWKATEPPIVVDSESWKGNSVPRKLGVWWLTWIVSGFVGTQSMRASFENDLQTATIADAISTAFIVASGMLAIAIVRGLTDRIDPPTEQNATV